MIDVERLELAIRQGGHPARQLEGEKRNEHGTLHLISRGKTIIHEGGGIGYAHLFPEGLHGDEGEIAMANVDSTAGQGQGQSRGRRARSAINRTRGGRRRGPCETRAGSAEEGQEGIEEGGKAARKARKAAARRQQGCHEGGGARATGGIQSGKGQAHSCQKSRVEERRSENRDAQPSRNRGGPRDSAAAVRSSAATAQAEAGACARNRRSRTERPRDAGRGIVRRLRRFPDGQVGSHLAAASAYAHRDGVSRRHAAGRLAARPAAASRPPGSRR